MKVLAYFGAVGGCLGAVVAVLTHYLSRTLPTEYTVGYTQIGDQVSLGRPPLVHPSWWPALPVAIVIGVAIGMLLGLVADRVGVRVGRSGDAPA